MCCIVLCRVIRYHPALLQQPALQFQKVDTLYLDDTFLEPQCEFPARVCVPWSCGAMRVTIGPRYRVRQECMAEVGVR